LFLAAHRGREVGEHLVDTDASGAAPAPAAPQA